MRIPALALALLMALPTPAPAAPRHPGARAHDAAQERAPSAVALSSKERRRRERYLHPGAASSAGEGRARERGGARKAPPKSPGQKATDALTFALGLGLIGWLASASLPAFGLVGLLALLFPLET